MHDNDNDDDNVYDEFRILCEDEAELYERKNKDYAGGGDPFGNFKRIANILSNYKGLRIDHPLTEIAHGILKQLDCVLDTLANNRTLEEESIQRRLRDISVYCKIGTLMLDRDPDLFPVKEKEEAEENEEAHDSSDEEDDEDEDEESEDDEDEDEDEEEDRPGKQGSKRGKPKNKGKNKDKRRKTSNL
jgi:hypothetical protein